MFFEVGLGEVLVEYEPRVRSGDCNDVFLVRACGDSCGLCSLKLIVAMLWDDDNGETTTSRGG